MIGDGDRKRKPVVTFPLWECKSLNVSIEEIFPG